MLECVGKKKQTLYMHLKLRAYKLLGNIKFVRKILLEHTADLLESML
jgi:hypothetical protein